MLKLFLNIEESPQTSIEGNRYELIMLNRSTKDKMTETIVMTKKGFLQAEIQLNKSMKLDGAWDFFISNFNDSDETWKKRVSAKENIRKSLNPSFTDDTLIQPYETISNNFSLYISSDETYQITNNKHELSKGNKKSVPFNLNKNKKHRSKAICVMGSGRSGTSAITRCIDFLGAYIGPDFNPPNRNNPKGYYEQRNINHIHEAIKRQLGKRPFPQGWENQDIIQPYKERLKRLVENEFLDKPLWGWKDPRNCENVELWRDIFDELSVSSHYLIIVRNPLDVMASMQKAWNRETNHALLQWKIRVLHSLKKTQNENRIIINYNELLTDSLSTMKRIANTFNISYQKDDILLKTQLDNFIEPGLRHFDSGLDELEKQPEIDEDIKKIYRLCVEGGQSQKYLQSNRFAKKVNRLYDSLIKSGQQV